MALQGTLDTFALADVLRLLAATRKAGRLEIEAGRVAGSVWVDDGRLMGALATEPPPGAEGLDAVVALLRFEEGSFTFHAGDVDPPEGHLGDPMEIDEALRESESLLEEWRAIEEVVPSLGAWVRLCPHPGNEDGEVVLDPGAWQVVALVGRGATVSEVVEVLGGGLMHVLRTVRDLAERHLLEVEVEAVAAPVPAGNAPEPGEPVDAVAGREAQDAGTPRDDEWSRPGAGEAAPPIEPAGPVSGVLGSVGALGGPTLASLGLSSELAEDGEAEHGPAEHGPAPEVQVDLRDADAWAEGRAEEASDLSEQGLLDPGPAIDEATGDPSLAPLMDLSPDELAASGALGAAEPMPDEAAEIARQLANLSPRAAKAVAAAARATSPDEREAALAAIEAEDDTIDRGLLLRFLGSMGA